MSDDAKETALLAELADALEVANFPRTAPFVREGHGLFIHLPWVCGMLREDLREALAPEPQRLASRALDLTIKAMAAFGIES